MVVFSWHKRKSSSVGMGSFFDQVFPYSTLISIFLAFFVIIWYCYADILQGAGYMAKKLSTILILLTCLILSGCQLSMNQYLYGTQPETTAPTEPVTTESTTEPSTEPVILTEGMTLLGYDFGGLTAEQAEMMLRGILSGYRLTLTAGGEEFVFTGECMGLGFSQEVFLDWIAGGSTEGLLYFNEAVIHSALESALGEPVRNAAIEYNDTIGRFVTASARTGTGIQTKKALEAVHEAVSTLSPTASAEISTYIRLPSITNGHSWITSAIDAANRYLDLTVTYTYRTATQTLSKADLALLVSIDENFTVSVSEEAVRSFVARMAAKHGTDSHTGTYEGHAVTFYETVIDQEAMCAHLLSCLSEFRSDSFTVPYIQAENTELPYGGNFVEVDLTQQQLFIHQNGKAVFSTPIVSGDVPTGDRTKGGVFSIYEKDTQCWLVGSDFRDYVNYWIAFNGNIGIHDASWRQDFGGSIYRYDGSHGCVNLPQFSAPQVYSNVSVGTLVIVHGGEAAADTISQVLTGTESYTLTADASSFRLDAAPLHTADITYDTSDPRVVTVSATGLVTVIGPGTAQITVRSLQTGPLQSAELTVQITVEP